MIAFVIDSRTQSLKRKKFVKVVRIFSNQHHICVLCISCPSAIEFSAILFLLFARSSSNSPRSFQRFRRTLVLNFIQIRLRVKNFPIDPHCKTWPQPIFTMEVYGDFSFIRCRIHLKFCLRVCLKR